MSNTLGKSTQKDAADWDARLRAPDCTDTERDAFKRWRQDSPENQRQFDDLQTVLGGLRSAHEAPEIRSMREAALNAASPPARQKYSAKNWGLGIAAAASVLVAALFFTDIRETDYLTSGQDLGPSYATAVGERSTMNLADGTIAILNTNTRLRVDYSEQERRVLLLQGQALFDVAKDADRPFVVVAGEQRITAIGTVFDVRLDGQDVQVTLVEGVVEVMADAPLGTNLNGPSTQPTAVRLTAGQQLLTTALASTNMPKIAETDVEHATIWREGRAFFEDAPLAEVVAEMNRYSTTEIVLDRTVLGMQGINGMFRTGQQANFAEALETYYPLRAERVSKNRILLKAE